MTLLGRKRDPVARFWDWFVAHEGKLFESNPPDPIWVKTMGEELKRVHRYLVWEVSCEQGGKREFVISADGIREGFTAVESLADAAPPLPRWRIVRFRPRVPDYAEGALEFGNLRLDPSGAEFALGREGDRLAIQLFLPGCPTEGDRAYSGAGFILLDMALGEYDMGCKVGFVSVCPFDANSELGPRWPFTSLREKFDAAFQASCSGPH
jgi:hypothetical protein